MKKALSPKELLSIKDKVIPFVGRWFDMVGQPDKTGVWFIWGNSGQGKSNFAMQLAIALAENDTVLYNSLEEGTTKSIRDTARRHGVLGVNRRLRFVSESMGELVERLGRPRQPRIVIIDSFQYTQMTYRAYLKFKEEHADRLIIFLSHANGSAPLGRSAVSAMYDAALKIWVQGHRAFSRGRFIGELGYYDIWPSRAEEYWGNTKNKLQL